MRDVLKTLLGVALVALIVLAPARAGLAGPPDRFVVFGDSLSDPGNAFVLLKKLEVSPFNSLIPDAPYARGVLHFSNGPTWIEQLALLDHALPSTGPAFLLPTVFSNYAVGGARARLPGPSDLSAQVELFRREFDGNAPAARIGSTSGTASAVCARGIATRSASSFMTRCEGARMTRDLFELLGDVESRQEPLGPGAVILRGFATPDTAELLAALQEVIAQAPFRNMVTPGGFRMSVAMTNCGALGWVSDNTGYRYDATDPDSGCHWPRMPDALLQLAKGAASRAGFDGFVPDACLINRYEPGARLSLHQDKNERDLGAPIVSVSLGIPAVFLFGGAKRADKTSRVPLAHGDVVVWGGPARLRYHGVMPLKEGHHPSVGGHRINLTFRKAA